MSETRTERRLRRRRAGKELRTAAEQIVDGWGRWDTVELPSEKDAAHDDFGKAIERMREALRGLR